MNGAQSFRAEGKRRKASRVKLASVAAPVAFMHTENAHALDLNPNRGKRSASRANLNLADSPAGQRNRVGHNDGRRRHGQTCRTPYLETSNARIPALGSTLSKRVPRA